jgi:prolyl oligopeptidase
MREWHRGTSLSDDSKVVHEGDATDVSAYMYVTKHRQHRYTVKGRAITFYTSQNAVLLPGPSGEDSWHELKVPADADVSIFADQLVVQLRSAWTVGAARGSAGSALRTFAQGSLVAAGVEDFVRNSTCGKIAFGAFFCLPSTTMPAL